MIDSSQPLTDLLPESAARLVRRDYFLRLTTVAVLALSLLLIAHALLLLPSYIYLRQEVADRTHHLEQTDEALAGTDTQAASQLAAIRTNAQYLAALAGAPTSSGAIRLIVSVPHTGITLSGFSYAPSDDGKSHVMRLTGTANTRESLRNYDLALSSAPWASNVELPISAYAKEQDIPFAITVTGTFTSP